MAYKNSEGTDVAEVLPEANGDILLTAKNFEAFWKAYTIFEGGHFNPLQGDAFED
jgi:hypothetical protein